MALGVIAPQQFLCDDGAATAGPTILACLSGQMHHLDGLVEASESHLAVQTTLAPWHLKPDSLDLPWLGRAFA